MWYTQIPFLIISVCPHSQSPQLQPSAEAQLSVYWQKEERLWYVHDIYIMYYVKLLGTVWVLYMYLSAFYCVQFHYSYYCE